MTAKNGTPRSMDELLVEALAPQTLPAHFLEVLLPAFGTHFSERARRLLDHAVEVGIEVTGAHGGAWTLVFEPDGEVHVARGRQAERPLLTVRIAEEEWFGIRDFLGDFEADLLDWIALEPPEPVRRFDEVLAGRAKALDLLCRVEIARFYSDGAARFVLRFNGWAPEAAAEIGVGLNVDDLEDLVDGALSVREALEERRFRVDGNVGALMPLSGVISAMYPTLKRWG